MPNWYGTPDACDTCQGSFFILIANTNFAKNFFLVFIVSSHDAEMHMMAGSGLVTSTTFCSSSHDTKNGLGTWTPSFFKPTTESFGIQDPLIVGSFTLLNVCSSRSNRSEKSCRFSLSYLRGVWGSGSIATGASSLTWGVTSGLISGWTSAFLKCLNRLFKKSQTLSASECARATMHSSP